VRHGLTTDDDFANNLDPEGMRVELVRVGHALARNSGIDFPDNPENADLYALHGQFFADLRGPQIGGDVRNTP
jgi:hypothetical protein